MVPTHINRFVSISFFIVGYYFLRQKSDMEF